MNAKQVTVPRKSPGAKTKAPNLVVMKRQPQRVLLEYHSEAARRVCIAGSFNDWKPDGLEMIPLGGGKWVKELMLPPGAHEYRFIVDGKWISDPTARHTTPNPFGEINSLLIVPGFSDGPPAPRATPRPSL